MSGSLFSVSSIELHAAVTQLRGLQYQFTPKHHGHDPAASRWILPTRDAEFSVFDAANLQNICDDSGNLYGIAFVADGSVAVLGSYNEQLAEFPVARVGEPWHGYPVYPVNDAAPAGRGGQACRPAKSVFARLEAAGLISDQQRKRLAGGKFI